MALHQSEPVCPQLIDVAFIGLDDIAEDTERLAAILPNFGTLDVPARKEMLRLLLGAMLEGRAVGTEARRELFAIAEKENMSFDLERHGILHIYHEKLGFDFALRGNSLLRKGGLDRHAITSSEIHAIEPALQGTYYGGFFTPSDATGDIHKFTRGLADACIRRGATFIFDANVENIVSADAGFQVR